MPTRVNDDLDSVFFNAAPVNSQRLPKQRPKKQPPGKRDAIRRRAFRVLAQRISAPRTAWRCCGPANASTNPEPMGRLPRPALFLYTSMHT
jgi:hypothetical protein